MGLFWQGSFITRRHITILVIIRFLPLFPSLLVPLPKWIMEPPPPVSLSSIHPVEMATPTHPPATPLGWMASQRADDRTMAPVVAGGSASVRQTDNGETTTQALNEGGGERAKAEQI